MYGSGLKKCILIYLPVALIILVLTSYGCKDKLLDPSTDSDSPGKGSLIASMSVNPSEGWLPLITRITVSGEHPQGNEKIEKYILDIEAEDFKFYMEKTAPIDTVLVIVESKRYTIKGSIIDATEPVNKNETLFITA